MELKKKYGRSSLVELLPLLLFVPCLLCILNYIFGKILSSSKSGSGCGMDSITQFLFCWFLNVRRLHILQLPSRRKKKNLSIYLQGVRKRNRLGKHPLLLVVKEELGEKKDFRLSPRCGHVLFNLFISNRIQPFTTCKAFH